MSYSQNLFRGRQDGKTESSEIQAIRPNTVYKHLANYRLVLLPIGVPQRLFEHEYGEHELQYASTLYLSCSCESQAGAQALALAGGRAFLLYRYRNP